MRKSLANEVTLSMRVTHRHPKGSNPTDPTNGAIYPPINFFVMESVKLNIATIIGRLSEHR